MGSVGSNAGLHTYRKHAWSDNLHMYMSMAMDCLLLASWLGAFVYTTMLLFGSLYPSKCDLEA